MLRCYPGRGVTAAQAQALAQTVRQARASYPGLQIIVKAIPVKKVYKDCSVYKRPDGFIIFGSIQTPYGGVGRAPATKLPLSASPAVIGGTVLRILGDLSGEVIDVDLAATMGAFRKHMKDLGLKTVAALEKGASVVSVDFDGDTYSVTSTRKDDHGANTPTGSRKLSRSATAEEIGKAVLAALGGGKEA